MPPPTFHLFTSLRYDPLLLTTPQNNLLSSPSPYYMLSHHRDRIHLAALHFNWTTAAASISGDTGLRRLTAHLGSSLPQPPSNEPLRVKILLDHEGKLTIESGPTPSVPLGNLFPARLPWPRDHEPPMPEVSSLTGGVSTASIDSLPGTPTRSSPYMIKLDAAPTTPSSYTSYKTTSRSAYDSARARAGINSMTAREEVLLVSEAGEVMEGSLTTPYFWRGDEWVTPPVSSGGQIGSTRRWALEAGICVEGVVRGDELVEGEECWISNGVRGFIWGRIQLE